MIRRERARSCAGGACAKCALWLTLALGGDRLSARQHPPLTARFRAQARRRLPRSCPRVVRQPMRSWPRKTRNQSWQGLLAFQILALKR